MKEAILIIIGALISCGTTCFLDWLKSGREEKAYYRRKREETYLEMLESIDDIFDVRISKHFQPDKPVNIKKSTANFSARIRLYCKKDIADYYHRLMTKLIEYSKDKDGFTFAKWDKLVSDIKEDLNIKE